MELLRAAVEAEHERPLPAELKGVLDRTDGGSAAWIAATRQSVHQWQAPDEWRGQYPELSAEFAKLDSLSLALDYDDDGVRANVLGYSAGSHGAESVHAYLSERREALLRTEGANVFVCSLLVLSELAHDGHYCRGTLHLTRQAAQQLWETKVIVKP